MPAIALQSTDARTKTGDTVLDPLVLARLAGGSVTRAELQRDLAPLAEPVLGPGELKAAIDAAVVSLERRGLGAHEGRGRWRIVECARDDVATLLKTNGAAPGDWAQIRNVRLIAVALELAPASAQRLRALNRPDGLRAAILQRAYGLPKKAIVSPAKLRSQLAVVALQRAFGNKIRNGLGAGDGLAPKAGRLLAAQLAQQPRDYGTDTRLVTTLAAESVGASRTDIEGLRVAILRRWVGGLLGVPAVATPTIQDTATRPVVEALIEASSVPSHPDEAPQRPRAATRPDLDGFAAAVQAAARSRAHGWPGSYKAYVSHVWQALSQAHPEWGISEVEFKGMLAEAHRTGHVRLANADLKDRANLAEVQRSAVVYKNTVWHLVRVED